jgi:hypothetical protein
VQWLAWLHLWLQPFPSPLALPYLLFPDGRLPSRRWRPLVWAAVLAIGLQTIGAMTEPGRMAVFVLKNSGPVILSLTNPTGLDLGLARTVASLGWSLSLFVLMVSLAAPFSRYRHARGRERAQLRWFGYFGILTLGLFMLAIPGGGFLDSLALSMVFLVLPAATTIAILRHHLYDIDVIIRRTLVYSALTALLGGIYFGAVVVLQALFGRLTGERSALVIVLSTLLIAALFSPLRGRLQNVIDRRFFRQKYDAEQVLEQFAQSARAEVELEALVAELLAAVDETMRPESAAVWLKAGDGRSGRRSSRTTP